MTKTQIEQLKDLYKALLKIAEVQLENHELHSLSEKALDQGVAALGRTHRGDSPIDTQVKAVTEYSWNWLSENYSRFVRKDFSAVFEKFINT